jgi:transcription antitermination factor NusG
MTKEELEKLLIVGAKIKIGKEYSALHGFEENEIVELIEGVFENDTGECIETEYSPAIFNDELKDFDSIYHLFGNDFEDFLDCIVIE